MLDRIRNGWELTKASARALSADRELLLFPLISAIATLVVMASFAVPIVATEAWRAFGSDVFGRVAAGVVAWLFYFATYSVAIYFNTGLVGAALIRLEGGDPTVKDGIRIANSRLSSILGYAAIAATVGLLLKVVQERSGKLGKVLGAFLGVGWSLATFLVVPVLAATGLGPIDAIKRSADLFRRNWGEQLTGAGIGLLTGLAIFAIAIVGVPAVWLAASTGSAAAIVAVGVLLALAIATVVLVGSALQGVFSAALYRYATTGQGGFGFDPQRLAGAVGSRRALAS